MPEYFDSTSPTPKKTKVIKGYGNPHKEEKKKIVNKTPTQSRQANKGKNNT